MVKKEEIWDDVIKEIDEQYKGKSIDELDKLEKANTKRVERSIGWTDFCEDVYSLKKGQNVEITKERWTTYLGKGASIDADDQTHSEILSLLAMINERLKRVEESQKSTKKRYNTDSNKSTV